MEQDFFIKLPSHVIIDILSRLPIKTILLCKSTCKSWLHFLRSDEFINLHLSKSTPCLAIFEHHPVRSTDRCYEFDDSIDLEHHHLHYNLLTNLKLPRGSTECSANGLLLLCDRSVNPCGLRVCNPITREYVQIHSPQEFSCAAGSHYVGFGFGLSRVSGRYKVVRNFYDRIARKSECHVYTIGMDRDGLEGVRESKGPVLETQSWRSVATPLMHCSSHYSVLLHGNLHWLANDGNGSSWISRFDLETESFATVPLPPPVLLSDEHSHLAEICALDGCLCVCDNLYEEEIVVWVMKEYGVEKSWTKEFVVGKSDYAVAYFDPPGEVVRGLKVFKDGDILMAWGDYFLFYASRKTRIMKEIKMFEAHRFGQIQAILFGLSFVSLKVFGKEMARSY